MSTPRHPEAPRAGVQPSEQPAWLRWAVLALLLVVVFAVSALGSMATTQKIPTWYASLEKPGFTPPDWIFGPVWAVLYVLMAVAAWRIWLTPRPEKPVSPRPRRAALTWFALQLFLNALWPHAFFGLEYPRLGLFVLIALLVALTFTVRAFWQLDRPAALLLAPYAAWTLYATAINGAIVALN